MAGAQVQQEDHPPRVVRTQAEIDKGVERLMRGHRSRMDAATLKPLPPRRKLTVEQRERSIKHLYDDSIARKKRELEEIEKQMTYTYMKDSLMTTKSLSPEEQESMVERLYEKSIQRKEQGLKMLCDQVLARAPPEARPLGPRKTKEVAERLHDKSVRHKRDAHVALYQAYVLDRRNEGKNRKASYASTRGSNATADRKEEEDAPQPAVLAPKDAEAVPASMPEEKSIPEAPVAPEEAAVGPQPSNVPTGNEPETDTA